MISTRNGRCECGRLPFWSFGCYGLIGAALASRLGYGGATALGAVCGLAIYLINFYPVASAMFPWGLRHSSQNIDEITPRERRIQQTTGRGRRNARR